MKKLKSIVIGILSVITISCFALFISNLNLKQGESPALDVCITLKSPCLADFYSEENVSFSEFTGLEESENKKEKLKDEHKKLIDKFEKNLDSFTFKSDNITLANVIYCSVNSEDLKAIKGENIEKVERIKNYSQLAVLEENKAKNTTSNINDDGIFSFSKTKYTGESMLIGIIDTGIDITHDAFSNMPDGNVKYRGDSYLTQDILSNLNVKGDKSGLYRNQKIVYAYDYADEDKDVSNVLYGSHGYHVAGIASGNNGKDFYGASPDAQLAIFKVFPDGPSSSASQDCIINAIEDAMTIGCDVVNLSLGSMVNYTESNVYDKTIDMARKMGMAVIVANGNDGTSTKSGADDYSSSDMLDYSTTGSPASVKSAMGVGNCYMDLEKMHETSSWGCLPTMEIKPDISAPGTDIRSAVYFSGAPNEYGRITGTSMASPNITGAYCNTLQYVKENREKFGANTNSKAVEIAEYLLMSTAVPIYSDREKAFLSPRQQGAGVANVERAVNSPCYLTDINGFRPKITVGQDVLRTGIYEFSFIINNISDSDVNYNFEVALSCDKINSDGTLAFLPDPLKGDVVLFDGAKKIDTLNVNANSSKIIDAQVILREEEKEKLIKNFEKGAYIDGILFFNRENSSISLPFITYFGSYEEMNAFSSRGTGSPKIVIDDGTKEGKLLGKYNYSYNPYDFETEEEINYLTMQDDEKNSLSFDSTLDKLRFRVLRQVADFTIEIANLSSGEIIKSFKNMGPGYQKWNVATAKASGEYYQEFTLDFTPSDYQDIEDGSRLAIKFEGKLPYYGDRTCKYILPFTVDSSAPSISYLKVEGNNVNFMAEDNHYLQCYNILAQRNGEKEYLFEHYVPFFAEYKGQQVKAENIDITALLNKGYAKDEIFIEASDYAGNITKQKLEDKIAIDGYENLVENLPFFTERQFVNDKACGSVFSMDGANYLVGIDGYILTEYMGNNSSLKVVEGTTSIKNCNSQNLERVILPSTLKTICENAFKECVNLKEVVCLSIKAPDILGENVFTAKPKLVVPYYNAGYNREIYKQNFESAKAENCVVFDSFGGSFKGISIDGKVENPTKDGYKFLYWVDENGNKIDKIECKNQLLTAKYKSVTGNVKFSFYGGEIAKTYQLNQEIVVPQGILKPFNKVIGYKVNDEIYGLNDKIYYNGEDMKVEVLYEKLDYNLIYNVDGKKMNVVWREGDSLYIPSKDGFEFGGWYKDSDLTQKFEIKEDMESDVNLYAKWNAKAEPPKKGGCGCGSNVEGNCAFIMIFSFTIAITIFIKNKILRSK